MGLSLRTAHLARDLRTAQQDEISLDRGVLGAEIDQVLGRCLADPPTGQGRVDQRRVEVLVFPDQDVLPWAQSVKRIAAFVIRLGSRPRCPCCLV